MLATLSPKERHDRAIQAKRDITATLSQLSDRIDTITAQLGEYERRQAESNTALAELTSSLEKLGPQIIEARARQRLYIGTPDESQWTNKINALQKEHTTTQTMITQVQEEQRGLEEEIGANYQNLADERSDLIARRAETQQELSIILNEEHDALVACAQTDLAQWLTKTRETKAVIAAAQKDLRELEEQSHDALIQKYGAVVALPLLAQALPHAGNPTYQFFSDTMTYVANIQKAVASDKLKQFIVYPNENGFPQPRPLPHIVTITPDILAAWLEGKISRIPAFIEDLERIRQYTIAP